MKHRLIWPYLILQHNKRFCRHHEVVREMLQKKQKMAYVEKLYNSIYMHMRCCSEDLLYITLKMLGSASKTFYLRNIFRLFFRTHIFLLIYFCLTFLNQTLTFYWLFIYGYNLNIRYFWIFWNDFMKKQSTKCQQKGNKSQPEVKFLISKSHRKSQSW